MNLTTQQICSVSPDRAEVERIAKTLGLNKKLIELLMLRGYDNIDAINVFLHPDINNLYPPESMLGMKECCARLREAIDNGEGIIVYGDYDADGICAASILSLYLATQTDKVFTHIPDRIGEGYGLNNDSIERVLEKASEQFDEPPSLILTCDCGISAVEEVRFATEDLGVDVIVTDHHEVGETKPDCIIVNPHQPECKYPFKDLCGAGVALKIVQALGGIKTAEQFFDLAAIATVADLVSLVDENRLIVQLGLMSMANSKNLGVAALVNSLKLKTVTSSDIAFRIAPRINAAGRMGSAYRAFDLFTQADPLVVAEKLEQIIAANNERKTLCDGLYAEAVEYLKNYDLVENRAIVIVSEKWEKGITGILAARLVGDFKRPVFIIVKNNNEYKGTCRSIEGINIYELLKNNSDCLKEFGGHNQAAGFTILGENIERFKQSIQNDLKNVDENLFVPSLKYDLELAENEVTQELAVSLDLLEPTGNNGNPKPLFMTRTTKLTAVPLKNNISHTILKSSNGLQFFAYNSYKLNTYYNGATEREMIYELADNEYSPRLYLRGCAFNRLPVNDTLAKGGFLRMLNYPKADSVSYKTYRADELNSLIDCKFGILLIAGSKQGYDRCAELENDNIVMHEIFTETAANVYTRLMVSPELGKSFMLENYKKVIFIDTPPSENVIGYINRRTSAEVYIPAVDNSKTVFASVKADRTLFGQYYKAIKAHSYIKAPNVYAYFKALHAFEKTVELPQFIACLSVFIQLGLIRFAPDAGVTICNGSAMLENSDIYKTIEAWQA